MELIARILLVFLLIAINAFFVASEFALISVRRTRVRELVNQKKKAAVKVDQALNQMSTTLSAVQLGVTIASLALGWIGEPAVATLFHPLFSFLPANLGLLSAHALSIILAFIVITVLEIILGELVPKNIAYQATEKTALFVITPLQLFAKIFSPVIWFLNKAGAFVLRLLGISGQLEHPLLHSEEEIKMILNQSTQGGVIEQREAEMVNNVFQLGDIPIRHIMVPRTDVVAFPQNIFFSELLKRLKKYTHSRYPIYDSSIDEIIGFIHVKDIYRLALEGKNDDKHLLELNVIREIIHVPESKKADDVLRDMRYYKIHIVSVNDEYGGTAGVATLEDILESLVGEISDEFDRPARDIQRQEDGSYLIDGLVTVERIQRRFHLPLKGQGYTTLGGLLFGLVGREPKVGDRIQIGDISLEVAGMEHTRITLVRLTMPHPKQKKHKG